MWILPGVELEGQCFFFFSITDIITDMRYQIQVLGSMLQAKQAEATSTDITEIHIL